MYIVFFGAPGVGKGTQAQLVASRNTIGHLSTGDEFRRNIREGTGLGKQVQNIVESGALVPDELTTAIVRDALAQEKFANGCIFDGFPRTIQQAKDLDAILAESGSAITCIVNIEVPESEIVSRLLLRGRADDNEEVIRKRLAVYHDETAPVIDYYYATSKVVTVNGNSTMEEVYDSVMAALGLNVA
ncbi:MAG: adenylate kinase [Candidatus Kapabacteria bacterium]|nr:adenylate kinase [Candidatus Kapabacteria bacterium]